MNPKLYACVEGNEYGYWTKPTKDNESTFIPLGKAVIIQRITENLETNEVRLELAMEYMGNPKTITVSREELSDNRLIQSLTKIGANVTRHRFDYLVESIIRQEIELEDDGYVPRKVFSHLGWIHMPVRNDEGQVVGSQLCYRANRLVGGYKAKYDGPYSVTPMGSYDEWKNMVVHHILGHTTMELVLLASLSAIVNGLISPLTTGESPIFHLCGPSGCGKTTALHAACSVFGLPYDGENRQANKHGEVIVNRSVYGSWGATENATTVQCCGNMGAAIILNELGKFDGKDMTNIVYNLSEGTDKTRLDKTMQTYTSEGYATSILSSGEISLLDRCKSKATGLQVRVMEISDPLTASAEQARKIKETCRNHNGWAASMLAQYIIDNGGANMVLPIYRRYCQSLLNTLPNNSTAARFIEKFPALIMTTAELASKALDIPFNTAAILQYFADRETIVGNSRNVLADSYRIMIEACRTYKTCFYRKGENDPTIKSHGRITMPNKELPTGQVIIEEYQIRRDFVEEVLDKKGFKNFKACYAEWRAMGVLDHDSDRFTRSKKIDPASDKYEDVFVLRVFGTAIQSAKTQPKSKLVQKPSPQLASLLNADDEKGGEEDA